MIVKVVPIPGDNLKLVMMKINGKQLVHFYDGRTGALYRPHISLKEVNPNKKLRMHPVKEESIIIGRIDL